MNSEIYSWGVFYRIMRMLHPLITCCLLFGHDGMIKLMYIIIYRLLYHSLWIKTTAQSCKRNKIKRLELESIFRTSGFTLVFLLYVGALWSMWRLRRLSPCKHAHVTNWSPIMNNVTALEATDQSQLVSVMVISWGSALHHLACSVML